MENQALTPKEVARWTRIGVLSALAMLLGYAETFVPIPIPGVKLGLANIAVLAALADGDVSGAFCISCIKVLAAGLLFGSPLTMAYSAAGTLLAFSGMAPLSRLKTMRLVMVSIVGAVLHEIGQLAVASVLLGTTAVWYTAPLLLTAGCVTGTLCGTLASRLSLPHGVDHTEGVYPPVCAAAPEGRVSFGTILLVGAVVVVLHLSQIDQLVVCTVLSVAICLLARVEVRALLRSIKPLLAIAVLTFAIQLVLAPQTAVEETARSCMRLFVICALCLAFMTRVPTDQASALIARLVSPLERLGIRTAGFVLACDVALRLIPTLGSIFEDGGFRIRDIPQIIPQAYAKLYEQLCTPRG